MGAETHRVEAFLWNIFGGQVDLSNFTIQQKLAFNWTREFSTFETIQKDRLIGYWLRIFTFAKLIDFVSSWYLLCALTFVLPDRHLRKQVNLRTLTGSSFIVTEYRYLL